MNFSNIKEWTITEGSVKQVTDSNGIVLWKKQGGHDYSQDYFFVEDASGSANTLTITKKSTSSSDVQAVRVYCSTDQTTWVDMGNTTTSGITATIPANGKLYLKATANRWSGQTLPLYSNHNQITASGNYNVGGNIMSLLYGDNFLNVTFDPTNNTYAFGELLYQSATLVDASNLILPSNVTDYSYSYMFGQCTSLITPPALPATTLTPSCYEGMFDGCTSLTTAPALPATTLANGCYRYMFSSCSALTTTPALPATTLNIACYDNMFGRCTSLTTAPALPATTLARNCYGQMFSGCSSLNSVTTYANDISASDCLYYWLSGVSATGDFYNLGSATYPSGTSGIPTGWTEYNSL